MLRTASRLAPLALAACLVSATAPAQQEQATFADPANLAGERISPRTGRELPIDHGASGLQQLLRKLNTRASLMNIVAHPDDEDGGMLTFYSRGLGARVADLSLTRGEGGQNAMTGDFEDALGLLRTQELLASDRYSGVDQFFGTQVDFGFSKTKAESFSKWGHERVLYDVVRAIRIYRPLVLVSTWIGAATDGHGQHQVSGQITQEAFLAAGDPTVFPELTREGILPWQPLKVYARVPMQSISPKGLFDYATGQYVPAEFTNYVTGKTSTRPPSVDVVVHEGTRDPLLTYSGANPHDISDSLPPNAPVSYVQFSRIGLGLQKSQIGPGVRMPGEGDYDVSYHLYGSMLCSDQMKAEVIPDNTKHRCLPAAQGASNAATFFDGIDTSIGSLQELPTVPTDNVPAIAGDIDNAIQKFDPANPAGVAPQLAHALRIVTDLVRIAEQSKTDPTAKASALHELRIKRTQLNDALALSLGLSLDATADNAQQLAGKQLSIAVAMSEDSNEPIILTGESLTNSTGTEQSNQLTAEQTPLSHDHPAADTMQAARALTRTLTRPYFHRDSIETPVYTLSEPALRNAPAPAPALTAWASANYAGTTVTFGRVVHKEAQPISFVPPASLALPHAQLLPRTAHHLDLTLNTLALDPAASTSSATLDLPARWEADLSLALLAQTSTSFHIIFPSSALDHTEAITARAKLEGQTILEGFHSVGYGELPHTNLYTPATTRIVPADLKLPTAANIAYLPGTGDAAPEALRSLGLPVTTLSVDDLTATRLAAYSTVILGVRTYNAHPDLHGAPTAALLDYARNGGNVLVQYQTTEFTAADAPYPLSLGSNEKVVDETAPVALLDPKSTLLTTPNRITPTDFNGWIEERGHGFLSSWDEHYIALTETHDPGAPTEHVQPQSPQRGGLITVQLGKGRWTYCAFALYRQLPEAVPGAYRLFINLINP